MCDCTRLPRFQTPGHPSLHIDSYSCTARLSLLDAFFQLCNPSLQQHPEDMSTPVTVPAAEPMWTTRLASLMQELGPACSADAASFRGLLQRAGQPIDELTIAEALALMARSTPGAPSGSQQQDSIFAAISSGGSPKEGLWGWKVVMDGLKERPGRIAWPLVAAALDHRSFLVPAAEGFRVLAMAFKHGSGGEVLPAKALVGAK
jgi:hypothetical protein